MRTVALTVAHRLASASSARVDGEAVRMNGDAIFAGMAHGARTLFLVWKFDPFRVAPQPLERVEAAALAAEDVHDEVEVVEQYPFGAIDTFRESRTFAEVLLQRVAN